MDRCWLPIWVGFLCCLGNTVIAQDLASDLIELPFEDLVNMEVVASTAGKRELKLEDTPAPLFVIGQEDIRRSGVRSIPDLLRMVPGVQVAQIGSSEWSVSSRGLGGRFSRYLLVMVDGRSIYNPMFSGVNWDEHNIILEDIDRIEVVRGPSGNLWGSNAVNGVINIVTRRVTDSDSSLTVGGGSGERAFVTGRYTNHWGEGFDDGGYRVSYQFNDREGLESSNLALQEDNWQSQRLSWAGDWIQGQDTFNLNADIYRAETSSYWPRYNLNTPYTETINPDEKKSGFSVQGRWRRQLKEKDYVGLRVSTDASSRNSSLFDWRTENVDIEAEYVIQSLAEHVINMGVFGRFTRSDLKSGTNLNLQLNPPKRQLQHYNFYLQDSYNLTENFVVTGGILLEEHSESGGNVQPSLRFLWHALDNHRFWGGASQAQSTPSRAIYESSSLPLGVIPPGNQLDPNLPPTPLPILVTAGNDGRDIENAEVTAFELGYRYEFDTYNLDLAYFYNDYEKLLGIDADTDLQLIPSPDFTQFPPVLPEYGVFPLHYSDTSVASSWGIEWTTHWRPLDVWLLRYSGQYIEFENDTNNSSIGHSQTATGVLYAVPEHSHSLSLLWNVTESIDLDVWLHHVAELESIPVDSYTSLNIRAEWRPVSRISLSMTAENLTDSPRVEFSREVFSVDTFEVEQKVYLQLEWRFD